MKGLWKDKIQSESKTSPDTAPVTIPATPIGATPTVAHQPHPSELKQSEDAPKAIPLPRRKRRRGSKGRKDERLCVSVEPETREDLLLLAWHEDLTESSVVRMAIEDFLRQRKKQIDHARSLKSQIVKAG